jgi:hypothetical protein
MRGSLVSRAVAADVEADTSSQSLKLSRTKLRVGFETFASSIPAQHYPLSPPTTPSPAYGLQHARSQTLIRIGNQRPAALRLAGSASAAATCCLPACSKPACSKKTIRIDHRSARERGVRARRARGYITPKRYFLPLTMHPKPHGPGTHTSEHCHRTPKAPGGPSPKGWYLVVCPFLPILDNLDNMRRLPLEGGLPC